MRRAASRPRADRRPGESRPTPAPPRIASLVVTGMSGAGRSSTLKALEDLGFEAVDNLPLSLLAPLLARRGRARAPLAVGIDARARDFDPARLARMVERLRGSRRERLRLLFLDASDDTLARRYKETRRKHPLGAANRTVGAAIRRERVLLKPLRAAADEIVETSDLAPPSLRRLLRARFGGEKQRLRVAVVSFAYRRGLPADADLVFDTRFLDNPHYRPTLKPLTGHHPKVGAYIAKDQGFPKYFKALTDLLDTLLPRLEDEGKSDVTIAVGCTGGRHRSVYVAEQLHRWLTHRGLAAIVRHRDLEAETHPYRRGSRTSNQQGRHSS
ncbi:MAG TPA: RNase adapter RapZ [Alphaproteobacteria bacterium]|nr:RNase adapter RapZ [Alphaproteobacteria bacterium]